MPGPAILNLVTRKQVAQRLGKSLATVRRMEGVLLHPTQDARGVNQFDPTEVERVAREVTAGRIVVHRELRDAVDAHALPFDDANNGCESCTRLQSKLDEQRSSYERELATIRDQHNREALELVKQVEAMLASLA